MWTTKLNFQNTRDYGDDKIIYINSVGDGENFIDVRRNIPKNLQTKKFNNYKTSSSIYGFIIFQQI
jgi:hypothetical protein